MRLSFALVLSLVAVGAAAPAQDASMQALSYNNAGLQASIQNLGVNQPSYAIAPHTPTLAGRHREKWAAAALLGGTRMNDDLKKKLQVEVMAIGAHNQGFKALLGSALPPVLGVPPGVPIPLETPLKPLIQALRLHADNVDKLLKLLSDVLEAV